MQQDTTIKVYQNEQNNQDISPHGIDTMILIAQPWIGGIAMKVREEKNGGQSQNRTADTRLFRPLLYRLS